MQYTYSHTLLILIPTLNLIGDENSEHSLAKVYVFAFHHINLIYKLEVIKVKRMTSNIGD